jgi:hypothetical protein
MKKYKKIFLINSFFSGHCPAPPKLFNKVNRAVKIVAFGQCWHVAVVTVVAVGNVVDAIEFIYKFDIYTKM